MRSSGSGRSNSESRFPFSSGATSSMGSGRESHIPASAGTYFGVDLNGHTDALGGGDFAHLNATFSRAFTDTVDREKARLSAQPTSLNYEQRKIIVEDAVLGTTTPIAGLSSDQRSAYLALPEVHSAVNEMRDAIRRREFRGIGQTGQFFAALGQLSGNQTFSALGTISMASSQSFLALDALTATSGTLAQVGAASVVGFSVIQIGSALFGNRESNGFGAFAAAIFQGFAVLSKQIDQFRMETHRRFDRIEKILQISFSKMNERFDDLFLKLCVLDYLSNDINFKTALIDSRLQSVAIQIQSGFDAVLAHLASDIRAIQNPNVSDYFKTMSSTEYNRLFQQCFTSINNASLPAYNGTHITAASALEKIDFLNQSGETGFSAHLAGILGYVFTKFKEHNPTLAVSGPGTINPLQATFAVSALDTLVQRTHLGFDRPWREHETKIRSAWSQFNSLKAGMTRLASSPDAFIKMIEEYRKKVQAVKTLIGSIIQDENRKFYSEKGVHASQVDSYPRLDKDLDAELTRFRATDIGKREIFNTRVELDGDIGGLRFYQHNFGDCDFGLTIFRQFDNGAEKLESYLKKMSDSPINHTIFRLMENLKLLELKATHKPRDFYCAPGWQSGNNYIRCQIGGKEIKVLAHYLDTGISHTLLETDIQFRLKAPAHDWCQNAILIDTEHTFDGTDNPITHELSEFREVYVNLSESRTIYNCRESFASENPIIKETVKQENVTGAINYFKSLQNKARKKLGERLRGDSELNNLLNQMEILRLATLGAFRLIGVSDEQAKLFFSFQGEPITFGFLRSSIPTPGAIRRFTKAEVDSSIKKLIDTGSFTNPGLDESSILENIIRPNILIADTNPVDISSLIAKVRTETLSDSSILRNYVESNIETLEELIEEIPRLERARADFVAAQAAEAAEAALRKVAEERASVEATRRQADSTAQMFQGLFACMTRMEATMNASFSEVKASIASLDARVGHLESKVVEKETLTFGRS